MTRLRALLPLTAALAACGAPGAPAPAERVPGTWRFPMDAVAAQAPSAMISSDAALATQAGLAILAAGGNAIDAAVATAFALAVVYPEAGNLGGGGFLVARFADGSEVSLDFREVAPLAATRDMYLDSAGDVTAASVTGHLAAGVPGAVAGLYEVHSRHGRLPWPQLLEPAIRHAEQGFVVDSHFAQSVAGDSARLRRFEASRALFLPGGQPLREGTTWRNRDLAAVLRRIAERGAAGFYEGETADLIVAEMRRGGGLITHEDLARYRPRWREPIAFAYRGHRVLSMPPASSGGITLAVIANILEAYDLRRMGWHSADALHLTAEAMRRAFATRNHYLGDTDFVDVPIALILSDSFATAQRATIDRGHATPSATVTPLAAAVHESEHTTNLAVVDAEGNAVALTTTVNDLYGSAVTVAGAGFVLNDEMDDFTSKVGAPNMYGLVQGEANAIVPGKRMLSAMTPTIVMDPDGRPLAITGGRGGPRIINGVWQVISNVIDHGMTVAEAVNAPRIHHQHRPDTLWYERGGLDESMVRELRRRGHVVVERSTVGDTPTIVRTTRGWSGTPDPRDGGLSAGL